MDCEGNAGARTRLVFMMCLTTCFFFVEIIVGYFTNSMALIVDSFHMLSDVMALIVAYICDHLAPKKWSQNTYGWARAEVLGALVNSVFLGALCFSFLIESIKRFYKPEPIHDPQLILIIGCCGLCIDLIGFFLFRGESILFLSDGAETCNSLSSIPDSVNDVKAEDDHVTCTPTYVLRNSDASSIESAVPPTPVQSSAISPKEMNLNGVILHVLANAMGSVIVIISACVMLFTGLDAYVDQVLTLLMVCAIVVQTWHHMIESGMILIQAVPQHIQTESMRQKLIRQIDGVFDVHEFHVWQLAGDRLIASAHVSCDRQGDYMLINDRIKEFFHNEGIHSTTVQAEFIEQETQISPESTSKCLLECPRNCSCIKMTCCGPQQGKESLSKMLAVLLKRKVRK